MHRADLPGGAGIRKVIPQRAWVLRGALFAHTGLTHGCVMLDETASVALQESLRHAEEAYDASDGVELDQLLEAASLIG